MIVSAQRGGRRLHVEQALVAATGRHQELLVVVDLLHDRDLLPRFAVRDHELVLHELEALDDVVAVEAVDDAGDATVGQLPEHAQDRCRQPSAACRQESLTRGPMSGKKSETVKPLRFCIIQIFV